MLISIQGLKELKGSSSGTRLPLLWQIWGLGQDARVFHSSQEGSLSIGLHFVILVLFCGFSYSSDVSTVGIGAPGVGVGAPGVTVGPAGVVELSHGIGVVPGLIAVSPSGCRIVGVVL